MGKEFSAGLIENRLHQHILDQSLAGDFVGDHLQALFDDQDVNPFLRLQQPRHEAVQIADKGIDDDQHSVLDDFGVVLAVGFQF